MNTNLDYTETSNYKDPSVTMDVYGVENSADDSSFDARKIRTRRSVADAWLNKLHLDGYYNVYSDGAILGNSSLHFGLNDITIAFILRSNDYTTSTQDIFRTNSTSTNRYSITLSATGFLTVYFESTPYVLSNYTLVDGNTYLFVITNDRNANANAYIYDLDDCEIWGNASTIDISSEFEIDIGNGNTDKYDWCNDTDSVFDIFKPIFAANSLFSADEVNSFVSTMLFPARCECVAVDEKLFDFSAGVDGLVSIRTTTSGNNDAVSDGTTSYNDVLVSYASADNSTHILRYDNAELAGKSVIVSARHFIPFGNTNVDGISIDNNTIQATGDWSTFSVVADFPTDGQLRIYLSSAGSLIFAGAGSALDDIINIVDLRVEESGDYLAYQKQTNNVQVISSAGLHAEVSGCSICPQYAAKNRIEVVDTGEWSAASDSKQILTQDLLTDKRLIAEWWVKSTSSQAFNFGDESTADRYDSALTVGTTWTKLNLDAYGWDGTNGELRIAPTTSFTGTLYNKIILIDTDN